MLEKTLKLHKRKWDQYLSHLDKEKIKEKASRSPLASARSTNTPIKNQEPVKLKKLVDMLSQPVIRKQVDRGEPTNDKNYHNLFVGVLRDPSPRIPDAIQNVRNNA